MEGMFANDTNRTKFIPVYLTTYKQAVSGFPPFLKAVEGYGYRVPHDVEEMMAKRLGIENKKKRHFSTGDNKSTKDQLVKDHLFMTDIRKSAEQCLTNLHPECNREHCEKVGSTFRCYFCICQLSISTHSSILYFIDKYRRKYSDMHVY